MSFASCRGEKTRKELVSKFDIVPVTRSKVLPGQKIEGCCGLIEDEYYMFCYVSRSSPRDNGFFYTGWHCAESFLALAGKPALPLFNPLKLASTSGEGGETSQGLTSGMCALNREAYAAINILAYAWGAPRAPLRALLANIVANQSKPISLNAITHLNNIVGSDKRQTMQAIIEDLRHTYPQMRAFSFPTIAATLAAAKKKSNF